MGLRVKYPRTFHLPGSEGATKDDVFLDSLAGFEGKLVGSFLKMDGECTSALGDGSSWARSLDSRGREDRDWFRGFWGRRAYLLGGDLRLCGENLYAKHSIFYSDLASYFLGFSVWRGDWCLSWDDTLEVFDRVGVESVPELYRGVFDLKGIHKAWGGVGEGYVVRPLGGFWLKDFSRVVGKWVREGHVQTDKHWSHSKVVPNQRRLGYDMRVN